MYFDEFEFYYICETTPIKDCFEDDCEMCDICRFLYDYSYIHKYNKGLLRTVYAEGEV